ncbi:alpha/beta fold hydrolase [Deinococcus maricopensis]|uniref:Alpha/beta hydrolase fold protein n=1 Tax=Deinococcus maricopensis (strain DSM 21211 / LMG 22137 / NRRL B-23946 / LB-34) TaxID=709986 RepID=E8UAW6_DEIML|nr:alpha/beta fold hydrolase [Deinococcus maricopensis]ADV68205.1 alpha/beta hydrolase fold protein [Deinococcus maricopensis DSM 21211]
MTHPVVLLHAYPLAAPMWDDQIRALRAAGRTPIAPNLPGFGGAPGAIQSLPVTAATLLNDLPDGPFDLVGLSMGGYLALEVLHQAPGRVHRLVLADTTARADTDERRATRHAQAERALHEGTTFLQDTARDEQRPGTYARTRPLIATATPEGVAGALRAMAARPDHRPTLTARSATEKPTLALVGANDPITPPDLAQELADLTYGRLHVIPDAGHLANLDQPAAFTAALLDFLRE